MPATAAPSIGRRTGPGGWCGRANPAATGTDGHAGRFTSVPRPTLPGIATPPSSVGETRWSSWTPRSGRAHGRRGRGGLAHAYAAGSGRVPTFVGSRVAGAEDDPAHRVPDAPRRQAVPRSTPTPGPRSTATSRARSTARRPAASPSRVINHLGDEVMKVFCVSRSGAHETI